MLGQLFQSLNSSRRGSSTRSSNPQLDATAEESYTTALLFPELSAFAEIDGTTSDSLGVDAQNRNALKPGSLDLQCPRDVRILIAQAGNVSSQEVLLYDSKPAGPTSPREDQRPFHGRPSSRAENPALATVQGGRLARASPVHSIPEHAGHRRTSSTHSTTSTATAMGAFQRAKLRRGSISSIQAIDDDLEALHLGREVDEIERIALSCIFDNAMSNYKGSSTKVHIVPLAAKPYDPSLFGTSIGSDVSGSLGRPPSLLRRPSSLSRSHIPGDTAFDSISASRPARSRLNKRTVLVTRTFSVTWVGDEFSDDPKSPGTARAQTFGPAGFTESQKFPRSQTFRSAMYAITIVLSLPVAPDSSPSVSRSGTFGRKSMRKDSRYSHVSMGSSVESDRKLPWTDLFSTDLLSSMTDSDVDDRVELIGRHWDIISRALSSMQMAVQAKLLEVLRPMSRIRKNPRLTAMAFASAADIKKMAESAASRVIRGMTIPRVQTGHGRWTTWRTEMRWLKNWASTQSESFFFQILLSVYLGTHLDWLHTTAPKWYKRKFRELQRLHPYSDLSVPSRTVLICGDKMAARRLIFILSTFLPSHRYSRGEASPVRPSTAASLRAYSQSPPKPTLLRQESLRMSINRKGKTVTTASRPVLSRTPSGIDDVDESPLSPIRLTESAGTDSLKSPERSRKSILAMTDGDPASQKSGTIVAGITPSVVLAPHFARQPSFGHVSHSRGSSTASATLIQPLQRSGSTGSESQWKWGSIRTLLGGLGSRRGSTSEYPDVLQTTDEGLGILGVRSNEAASKLEQMIDEIHGEGAHLIRDAPGSPEMATDISEDAKTQTKPMDIPLRMSLNQIDGVIDVQVPFLDTGSPIMSPSAIGDRHHHSGSSFGGSSFGHSSLIAMTPKEPERPPNVAGWIDKVHGDFTLQAVRPYADVEKDVKAAMRAEPNPQPSIPIIGNEPVERWMDVCTSIVADADSFTVRRIKLSRLVRFSRQPTAAVVTPSIHGIPPSRSLYGNPYSHLQLQSLALPGAINTSLAAQTVGVAAAAALVAEVNVEEKFEVETVAELDPQLADALAHAVGFAAFTSPSKTGDAGGVDSRAGSMRGRPAELNELEEANASAETFKDTKAIIMGTLESIAYGVAREQKDDFYRREKDLLPLSREKTVLKAGIRAWMKDVELRVAAIEGTEQQSRRAETHNGGVAIKGKRSNGKSRNNDDMADLTPRPSVYASDKELGKLGTTA